MRFKRQFFRQILTRSHLQADKQNQKPFHSLDTNTDEEASTGCGEEFNILQILMINR